MQSAHTLVRGIGLSCLSALCGCGGGGHHAPPDTTPEAFSFAAQTNVPTATAVDSNTITVAGINAAVPISVSGGEYSISGRSFTSVGGTVSNGQSVQLRIVTPTDFDTTVEATLTIGGISATFTVTTYPRDATPDEFSLSAMTDAVRGAVVQSDAITVAGINTPATITVSNGEYAIDGGSFTGADGMVENGQSVQLQADASTTPGDSVKVTLTIGGVAADFDVTTSSDVTPPTVSVLFPPPTSRTSGADIMLRGTASDDSGTIAKLQVNGVDATTSDGYAHWTAVLPLGPGANALIVSAEDPYLNADPAAAEVNVRRHERFVLPYSAAVDNANNRALVVDTGTQSLVAVDLATGLRTVLSTRGTPDDVNAFGLPYNVVLDQVRSRALVYDPVSPAVVAVDLTTGQRSILSGPNTPNGDHLFVNGRDMALDATNDRLLVLTSEPSIIAVDLTTGARTVLSDGTTPDTSSLFSNPWAIAVDAANDRALVTDIDQHAIYAVDLSTGTRSVFSDDAHPGSANPLDFAPAIAVDAARGRALVTQPNEHAVYAIDLATGARTVLSDTGIPDTADPFSYPWAFAPDDANGRDLIVDQGSRSLIALDLATGARTFVSRDEPAGASSPLEEPRGLELDAASDRLLVTDHAAAAVVAVDLATADRAIVSNDTTPDSTNPFSAPRAIRLDASGGRVFVLDDGPQPSTEPAKIFTVDLATGNRAILTDATTPDTNQPLSAVFDLAIDADNNRLLVTEDEDTAPSIIGVDLTTGARTLVSSDSVPSADNPFTAPEGIVIDAASNRALIVDSNVNPSYLSSVLAVDLDTGSRSLLSNNGTPDNTNLFADPSVLVLDSDHNRAFVADGLNRQVLQLELATGARTIVSGDPVGGGDNPLGSWLSGIAYDAGRDVVYVVDTEAAAVLAVDAETGQRIYLLH